jgi:hypothetical protein
MKFVGVISYLFAVLLFAGAVGVDVFTHICKKDGVEQAFVINTIDHCESEKEDLPECCQSADHQDEDDCCDDEIEHFKVDSDYSHSNSDAAPAVIHLVSNYTSLFDVVFVADSEELIHYGIDSGPPPLLVSERLSFIQSYLI